MTDREPALGAAVHERLIEPGVVLVGTTRRDGSARISGVEPPVMNGDLWLSMMRSSTKALDLGRDPRILLHSIVATQCRGRQKVRGTVRTETSPDVQRLYAETVAAEIGWRPVVGEFTLFAVDIEDVTYIGYDAESSAQHVARWPAGLDTSGRRSRRPVSAPASQCGTCWTGKQPDV